MDGVRKVTLRVSLLLSLVMGWHMNTVNADEAAGPPPATQIVDAPDKERSKESPETLSERAIQGTASWPNGWDDYSRKGDINYYFIHGKRLLFKAKREGVPSTYGGFYPTTEVDNGNWEYHSQHAGTFEDPKGWHEYTYPGDIHRYEIDNKVLFFRAMREGYPSRNNWHYPTREQDIPNLWTYMGLHAGTWQDPKTWDEPTWPGAIHWYAEKNLFFRSKVTGTPSAHHWHYPTTATSNDYWNYLNTQYATAPGITDRTKPYDKYTWVTAHNGYLDDLKIQLERGIRGFMLDLRLDLLGVVRMCHNPGADTLCDYSDPSLLAAFNLFIEYLNKNPGAVISLQFESYITREAMQRVINSVPALADYVYVHDGSTQWPTLETMIGTNKRILMFSDGRLPGSYTVSNKTLAIYSSSLYQVENTFNLGDTALIHKWECESRDGRPLSLPQTATGLNRLFVLNQFHSWGSSAAHAGDMDNNLTWLQRRVERYCGAPTGWRTPNFLAIDYNQTGDALPYAAALSEGGLYFYERNTANRDGDTVCVLPGNQHSGGNGVQYDLKLAARGCENDEIRSMELEGIRAGTRIELYDHPDGDRQDDFTLIDVKQSIPMGKRVRIDSLQGSANTFYYRKLAFHNNGLDGKISRIKVRNTPALGDISDAGIVFYEGNSGTQNIVCTVPYDYYRHFKINKSNFGCDNDEIRSAVVIKAGKGSTFTVTGSPEGGFSEGRSLVTFKRNILTPLMIGTFNNNYEDSNIKVEVSHGGNLDGYISYGYFAPVAPVPEPQPQQDPRPPAAPEMGQSPDDPMER